MQPPFHNRHFQSITQRTFQTTIRSENAHNAVGTTGRNCSFLQKVRGRRTHPSFCLNRYRRLIPEAPTDCSIHNKFVHFSVKPGATSALCQHQDRAAIRTVPVWQGLRAGGIGWGALVVTDNKDNNDESVTQIRRSAPQRKTWFHFPT